MVKVENLAFSYGTLPVLKNISLELVSGNIYGLLGENGVGKTTLLTLLCGLKKPLSGSIDVDGRDPFDRKPSLLQEQFYLPDEVSPVHSSAKNFALENGALWPRYDNAKFLEVMQLLEMDPEQHMDQMSAGQLKKTWICFALACNARYYYMDEPTNGLDIPSKAQFRKAITKYTGEESMIVISTHQVRDLENVIDPIIILDSQEVLVNASLEEISSKLYFDYGSQVRADALYMEQVPGGCIQVYPNAAAEESKVNLEAFFNTVHAHKDVVKPLFRK
ncbi:MAG: ATP-binding cassette domain-containing protein [Bacteroidales bacterium]|nr:ATP-binding cassette domain-containing protein [Bacteroidales bacterium]